MYLPPQDPFIIYKYPQQLWQTVGGVQQTGKLIFQEAYIVKHLETYIKLIPRNLQPRRDEFDYEIHRQEMMFFENSIIDCVKIIIYFESLYKACLLSKGFVVHLVKNDDRNTVLRKKQRKQPIAIAELPEGNVEDVLTSKTINFNWFLENRNYRDMLPQTPSIFATLDKLNSIRNELHLHYTTAYVWSPHFAQEILDLIVFVNNGPYFLENRPPKYA